MSERNSSRVVQPPGGKSQISFGGDEPLPSPVKTKVATASVPEEQFQQADSQVLPMAHHHHQSLPTTTSMTETPCLLGSCMRTIHRSPC